MSELHVDAATAVAMLGVSRATLYAYVSRGLVRSAAAGDDPRRRVYDRHDIEVLMKRRSAGRRPREAAAATLDWGLPVLSSGITLIEDGRLFYRGRDAARWAETATLEETARLLWNCGRDDPFLDPVAVPVLAEAGFVRFLDGLPLTERVQALLPLVAAGRLTAWQRDGRRLLPGAAALLRAIAAAAMLGDPGEGPVHLQLARRWGVDARGADLLRRALVLLADHELNASTFAVRVVASTGASLGACLNAGIGALSGPLHGGTTSLVEILFDEVERAADAGAAVETRLRRGEAVPGFGHRLYPRGDARAAALLPLLPAAGTVEALVRTMAETAGRAPNIDFALVALRRALGLPRGTAFALFAVGRSAGWIAHALEQHEQDRLIRPRARYVGPPVMR